MRRVLDAFGSLRVPRTSSAGGRSHWKGSSGSPFYGGYMPTTTFLDLPVIDEPWEPQAARAALRKWAGRDVRKFAKGFLFWDKFDGVFGNYKLQIALPKGEDLVAIKEALLVAGEEYFSNKDGYTSDVGYHLELYYTRMGLIPPWGQKAFHDLRAKDTRFVKRLLGPHRGSNTPRGYYRLIVESPAGTAYGPALKIS